MRIQTKQSLLYITIVAVIYVLIGILEFFIGPFILDVVIDNKWIQLAIYVIFLISVNLILTAYIASKVPYKIEGLRKLEKPKELKRRPVEINKEEPVKKEETTKNKVNRKHKVLHKKDVKKSTTKAPK